MPRSASWSTTCRPCQRLRAWLRLMLRPAPWQADENAVASLLATPASTHDSVPMLPPISTGWPVGR